MRLAVIIGLIVSFSLRCYAMDAAALPTRAFLLKFWFETGGATWTAEPWGTSSNPCGWSGVVCCTASSVNGSSVPSYSVPLETGASRPQVLTLPCQRNGELMGLVLRGFNLSGELPSTVASLELQVFMAADNPGLGGTLPRALLAQKNLVLVDIRNSSLQCQVTDASGGQQQPQPLEPRACSLPAGYTFSEVGVMQKSFVSGVQPAGASYACALYGYRNQSSQAGYPATAFQTTLTPEDSATAIESGVALSVQLLGPAAKTLVLSSPSFWRYQSCRCLELPNGALTAAQAPELGVTADGRLQATCVEAGAGDSQAKAEGSEGLITPAVLGGALAGVAVGSVLLAVAVTLAVLRCRSRRWSRLHSVSEGPQAGADLLDGDRGAAVMSVEPSQTSMFAPGKRRTEDPGGQPPRSPDLAQRLVPPASSKWGPTPEVKRAYPPGFGAGSGEQVTLVATDVEGSTELWEWQPDVMNYALVLHDKLVRLTLAACYGYEVTTEGDAFLVAFHEPVDAVRWALLLQSALLKLDWPPLLLEHPLCRPRPLVPVAGPRVAGQEAYKSAAAPLLVLFKGLAVRMGIATGVPSAVREHPVTGRMQYTGAILRLATGIAELGSGGQVLLEPLTFKGIHNKFEELDVVEREVQELADVVKQDTTIMPHPSKVPTASEAPPPDNIPLTSASATTSALLHVARQPPSRTSTGLPSSHATLVKMSAAGLQGVADSGRRTHGSLAQTNKASGANVTGNKPLCSMPADTSLMGAGALSGTPVLTGFLPPLPPAALAPSSSALRRIAEFTLPVSDFSSLSSRLSTWTPPWVQSNIAAVASTRNLLHQNHAYVPARSAQNPVDWNISQNASMRESHATHVLTMSHSGAECVGLPGGEALMDATPAACVRALLPAAGAAPLLGAPGLTAAPQPPASNTPSIDANSVALRVRTSSALIQSASLGPVIWDMAVQAAAAAAEERRSPRNYGNSMTSQESSPDLYVSAVLAADTDANAASASQPLAPQGGPPDDGIDLNQIPRTLTPGARGSGAHEGSPPQRGSPRQNVGRQADGDEAPPSVRPGHGAAPGPVCEAREDELGPAATEPHRLAAGWRTDPAGLHATAAAGSGRVPVTASGAGAAAAGVAVGAGHALQNGGVAVQFPSEHGMASAGLVSQDDDLPVVGRPPLAGLSGSVQNVPAATPATTNSSLHLACSTLTGVSAAEDSMDGVGIYALLLDVDGKGLGGLPSGQGFYQNSSSHGTLQQLSTDMGWSGTAAPTSVPDGVAGAEGDVSGGAPGAMPDWSVSPSSPQVPGTDGWHRHQLSGAVADGNGSSTNHTSVSSLVGSSTGNGGCSSLLSDSGGPRGNPIGTLASMIGVSQGLGPGLHLSSGGLLAVHGGSVHRPLSLNTFGSWIVQPASSSGMMASALLHDSVGLAAPPLLDTSNTSVSLSVNVVRDAVFDGAPTVEDDSITGGDSGGADELVVARPSGLSNLSHDLILGPDNSWQQLAEWQLRVDEERGASLLSITCSHQGQPEGEAQGQRPGRGHELEGEGQAGVRANPSAFSEGDIHDPRVALQADGGASPPLNKSVQPSVRNWAAWTAMLPLPPPAERALSGGTASGGTEGGGTSTGSSARDFSFFMSRFATSAVLSRPTSGVGEVGVGQRPPGLQSAGWVSGEGPEAGSKQLLDDQAQQPTAASTHAPESGDNTRHAGLLPHPAAAGPGGNPAVAASAHAVHTCPGGLYGYGEWHGTRQAAPPPLPRRAPSGGALFAPEELGGQRLPRGSAALLTTATERHRLASTSTASSVELTGRGVSAVSPSNSLPPPAAERGGYRVAQPHIKPSRLGGSAEDVAPAGPYGPYGPPRRSGSGILGLGTVSATGASRPPGLDLAAARDSAGASVTQHIVEQLPAAAPAPGLASHSSLQAANSAALLRTNSASAGKSAKMPFTNLLAGIHPATTPPPVSVPAPAGQQPAGPGAPPAAATPQREPGCPGAALPAPGDPAPARVAARGSVSRSGANDLPPMAMYTSMSENEGLGVLAAWTTDASVTGRSGTLQASRARCHFQPAGHVSAPATGRLLTGPFNSQGVTMGAFRGPQGRLPQASQPQHSHQQLYFIDRGYELTPSCTSTSLLSGAGGGGAGGLSTSGPGGGVGVGMLGHQQQVVNGGSGNMCPRVLALREMLGREAMTPAANHAAKHARDLAEDDAEDDEEAQARPRAISSRAIITNGLSAEEPLVPVEEGHELTKLRGASSEEGDPCRGLRPKRTSAVHESSSPQKRSSAGACSSNKSIHNSALWAALRPRPGSALPEESVYFDVEDSDMNAELDGDHAAVLPRAPPGGLTGSNLPTWQSTPDAGTGGAVSDFGGNPEHPEPGGARRSSRAGPAAAALASPAARRTTPSFVEIDHLGSRDGTALTAGSRPSLDCSGPALSAGGNMPGPGAAPGQASSGSVARGGFLTSLGVRKPLGSGGGGGNRADREASALSALSTPRHARVPVKRAAGRSALIKSLSLRYETPRQARAGRILLGSKALTETPQSHDSSEEAWAGAGESSAVQATGSSAVVSAGAYAEPIGMHSMHYHPTHYLHNQPKHQHQSQQRQQQQQQERQQQQQQQQHNHHPSQPARQRSRSNHPSYHGTHHLFKNDPQTPPDPPPPHHQQLVSLRGHHESESTSYHPLIVIDMGVHSLSVPALDALYGNLYDGVQVIQILPAHLKYRAAYFPPLKSQAQLTPGFFDAPGTGQALVPCAPCTPPSFPRLSLMFIQPANYSAVANSHPEVAERSGAVFCAAVREVLALFGAYECQEYECTFMVACQGPRVAAEAGLALHEWLLRADWPSDLLELKYGRLTLAPDGTTLSRGFRAKVGIFTGVPLSVVPHATTGRADYFGALVNRAARLMAGAKAGQILLDKVAGLEVLRDWRAAVANAASAAAAQARNSAATRRPRPQGPGEPLQPADTLAGHRAAAGAPEQVHGSHPPEPARPAYASVPGPPGPAGPAAGAGAGTGTGAGAAPGGSSREVRLQGQSSARSSPPLATRAFRSASAARPPGSLTAGEPLPARLTRGSSLPKDLQGTSREGQGGGSGQVGGQDEGQGLGPGRGAGQDPGLAPPLPPLPLLLQMTQRASHSGSGGGSHGAGTPTMHPMLGSARALRMVASASRRPSYLSSASVSRALSGSPQPILLATGRLDLPQSAEEKVSPTLETDSRGGSIEEASGGGGGGAGRDRQRAVGPADVSRSASVSAEAAWPVTCAPGEGAYASAGHPHLSASQPPQPLQQQQQEARHSGAAAPPALDEVTPDPPGSLHGVDVAIVAFQTEPWVSGKMSNAGGGVARAVEAVDHGADISNPRAGQRPLDAPGMVVPEDDSGVPETAGPHCVLTALPPAAVAASSRGGAVSPTASSTAVYGPIPQDYGPYLAAVAAAEAAAVRGNDHLAWEAVAVQVVDLGLFKMKGLADGQSVVLVQRSSVGQSAHGGRANIGSLLAAAVAATAGDSSPLVAGRAAAAHEPGAGPAGGGGVRGTAIVAGVGALAASGAAGPPAASKSALLQPGSGLIEELLVALPAPLITL